MLPLSVLLVATSGGPHKHARGDGNQDKQYD